METPSLIVGWMLIKMRQSVCSEP